MTVLTTKMTRAGIELFDGTDKVGLITYAHGTYTVKVDGAGAGGWKFFESLEAAEYFALAMVIEAKARAARLAA